MSLLQSGPRLVARSMETTTQSEVSIGYVVEPEKASGLGTIHCTDVPFQPTHWPPRITRLCLSVRLGITRLLLERRP